MAVPPGKARAHVEIGYEGAGGPGEVRKLQGNAIHPEPGDNCGICVSTIPGSSSPFRVSACAARTLNATGQSRVTLSLQQEHLRAVCGPVPGGKQPHIRPK